MRDLLWILLPCLLFGLAFAGLAVWLTTRKGNTIKDVLHAGKLRDAEAIRLEIVEQVKISTNLPIVALYIMSVIVAIGLPVLINVLSYLQSDETVALAGQIEDYQREKRIYVTYETANITADGSFTLPIRNTLESQQITFESEHIDPLTLTIELKRIKNALQIMSASLEEPLEIGIEGRTARMSDTVKVHWTIPAKERLRNEGSDSPGSKRFPNVTHVP